MEVLHLAGGLMEHFPDGSAPLRLWSVNSEEQICICYSSHYLGYHINVLTEQFLQGLDSKRYLY